MAILAGSLQKRASKSRPIPQSHKLQTLGPELQK